MSAKPIPELHDEELIVIFHFMNYDDLLVLRKVDERFSELVGYVLGRSMVWIKASEDCSSALKLFGGDEHVQVEECLVGRSIIGFKLNQDALVHIKKLIVPDPYFCNKLSTLGSLVHLEIREQGPTQSSSSVFLKALNLEVLNVNTNSSRSFVLDCPKLAKLRTNQDLGYLNVMFPSSVELLVCQSVGVSAITKFTNLKKLVCVYFDLSGVSPGQVFEKLTRLEEVHLFSARQNGAEANRLINQLNNNRQTLNLYYKGINTQADPLLNADVNSLSNVLTGRNLEVYANFLDFINDDLPQTQLTIDALDALNSKVLLKLTNLKSIQLTGEVTDSAKWTALLKASKIEELKLMSRMEQDLLDLIPSCCGQSLIKFELEEFDNLEFCRKLRYLNTLSTNKLFDFKLLTRLIRLPDIRLMKLVKESYKIEIQNGRVKCYNVSSLILDEAVTIFKLHTVRLVKCWSDLFYV